MDLKYSFEDEPDALTSKREEALKLAEELEMPSSIRTPGRTWTRYPEIEIGDVKRVSPEIEADGDIQVFTGREAVENAGGKLLNAIKTGENRLNAYHAALMNSLVYVKVDGKADLEICHSEDKPVFSHLIVETAEGAQLSIAQSFEGSPRVLTAFTELYLEDNSKIVYGAVESADAELFYSRRKAIVGRDASINWLNGVFGGKLNRTLVETVLKGDNSETEKIGVWYPNGEQHIDISMHVDHRGTNTRCDMKSRAVADNRARSVYEGLQHVGDNADDTSSFQDEKVLMLSEDTEVDASPKLMIEDPNVEASHAASAGKVPENELHYMESRGLSEKQARRLVVKGFFEPVMDEISLPELKQAVREEVEKKLDE